MLGTQDLTQRYFLLEYLCLSYVCYFLFLDQLGGEDLANRILVRSMANMRENRGKEEVSCARKTQ